MEKIHSMKKRVSEYIEWKRNLGYSIKIEAGELLRFAEYADSIEHNGPVTLELVLNWAHLAKNNSRLYQARRVEVVRAFTKYEVITEPLTEIPLRGILGKAHQRIAPYIYTHEELLILLRAARNLQPMNGLRPRTIETFIGLLAATGLRVCEALKLDRSDVDFKAKLIIIRETKFHKSRYIPIHSTTVTKLQKYADFRDQYHFTPQSSAFFLSEKGNSLPYSTINWNFLQIKKSLNQESFKERRSPRLYDLRHTFACRRLLQWYKDGVEVERYISSLSTYLGHVKITDTYWYLTGIQELLSIAAQRFEDFASKSNGGKV